MKKSLWIWLNGYIELLISGNQKERFLNLCKNKSINIWNIRKDEDNIYCYIKSKDYFKLKPVFRKLRIVPKIMNKYGFPYLKFKYRRRKPFLIGVGIGFVLMYICSLYVWNITIEGESRHTDVELTEYLESINICEGIKIKDVICNDIERSIRKEYSDIGWVSAQIVGTRLIISIKENTLIPEKEKLPETGSLVACNNGEIVSIITRNGTPLVKAGDVVNKGDVLVSGLITIYDDAGEVKAKHKCLADADIYIKYTLKYEDTIPLKNEIKEYIGKEKKKYSIIYKKDKINLFNSVEYSDNCDIILKSCSLNIWGDFYLPFDIEVTSLRKYKMVEKVYTEEEASNKCIDNFNIYLDSIKNEYVNVEDSYIDYKIYGNFLKAAGSVTLIEKVTAYDDIYEINTEN